MRVTPTSYLTRTRNLGDLRPARPRPDALIEVAEADRILSTATFFDMVDAVARGLGRHGLKPGARVAILSANRWEYLAAFLGIMKAGYVAVPLNQKLARDTLTWIFSDSEVAFAFVEAQFADMCPATVPSVDLDRDWAGFLDPGPFTAAQVAEADDALILYTSGSTSRPKGVPLSHGGHLWAIRTRLEGSPGYEEQRVIAAAPLYHMNALFTALVALAAGASFVLLNAFSAAGFVAAISRHRVTLVTSVPTMIALALRETQALASADLSCVKVLGMGSAPTTEKLLEDARAAFPNARINLGYGTTESGPCAFGAHPDGLPKPPAALGYPLAGVDVRIAGGGDDGILELRTPAVTRGYLNLPQKTAEVIDAEGWYSTGDLVHRDENGFYFFVGRHDNMFTCGGENIYPENVEQMIEAHPMVRQSCVVPVPDDLKGFKPVAFVVRSGEVSEDELKRFALANGPAYQHPRQIFFLEKLPLAGTNKVDRKALQRLAMAELGEVVS